MLTLLIFLIILGLLVLSHEFGHFMAARKSGMKVYEFGFGFPPRAIGLQRLTKRQDDKTIKKWRVIRGTQSAVDLAKEEDGWLPGAVYSFNWLPLGGFVKIKGEEGENNDPDSFVAKSFTKKALTLFAGVAMNVLLAAVIFSAGFMIGLPQVIDGTDSSATISDSRLQIMQVLPDMPAQKAGLKAGDIFTKIDALENPRLKQMQDYVDANKDQELSVSIKRGIELIDVKIKPAVYQETGKGGLGVSIAEVGTVRYPWYKAIGRGFIVTGLYLQAIVLAFYNLIKDLLSGVGAGAAVSGPIGIAVMTGQFAKLGFAYLLNFTAILSLNLAIINILPIPALDGGRILFLAIGRIFRRAVPLKYEQIAHTAGFVALMILVVVITIKDIGRFSGVFKGLIQKVF